MTRDVSSNVSLFAHPRKQNLLPGKQKCFLSNSETFHVSQVWFLLRKHCFLAFARLGKHGETLAGNNVSATMFPSLPKALNLPKLAGRGFNGCSKIYQLPTWRRIFWIIKLFWIFITILHFLKFTIIIIFVGFVCLAQFLLGFLKFFYAIYMRRNGETMLSMYVEDFWFEMLHTMLNRLTTLRWCFSEFYHTGRAKDHHFDLGGIRSCDLWMTSSTLNALTTELHSQKLWACCTTACNKIELHLLFTVVNNIEQYIVHLNNAEQYC